MRFIIRALHNTFPHNHREAFPETTPYRYAILDRDSIFNASVIGFGYTQPSIRGRLLEMIDDQQFDRALLLHQPQAKLVR